MQISIAGSSEFDAALAILEVAAPFSSIRAIALGALHAPPFTAREIVHYLDRHRSSYGSRESADARRQMAEHGGKTRINGHTLRNSLISIT